MLTRLSASMTSDARLFFQVQARELMPAKSHIGMRSDASHSNKANARTVTGPRR